MSIQNPSRRRGNLTRVLYELPQRQERGVYLPLDASVFLDAMPMAFSADKFRLTPGKQFDAFLIFDRIQILRSLL